MSFKTGKDKDKTYLCIDSGDDSESFEKQCVILRVGFGSKFCVFLMEKLTQRTTTFLRFWKLKIEPFKNLKHKILIGEIISYEKSLSYKHGMDLKSRDGRIYLHWEN